MNQFHLPQNQVDNLLRMAGQKMGKDPSELKRQLQNGSLDQAIRGLDANKQNQIKSILSNPQAVNQILENPQVRKLLEGLSKGK